MHQRRKKLDAMTKRGGLSNAYAATVSRIKAQQRSKWKLGMEVLMWISHSDRLSHVDEFHHALGVEEESMDLNIENIPAIETLTCMLSSACHSREVLVYISAFRAYLTAADCRYLRAFE